MPRGGIADLEMLRAGAAQTDGVISLAFGRDYSPAALAAAVTEESAATATLGQALIGSDRPIVVASGTPWIPGRPDTEHDPLVRDIASVIGRRLGLPVRPLPEADFGPFGAGFAVDQARPASTPDRPSAGSRPTPDY